MPFLPLSIYLDCLRDYFTTYYIVSGLALGFLALGGLYAFFKRSQSSRRRTNLLLSIMGLSGSMWVFGISSLAFCLLMADDYWHSPGSTIGTVAKVSLIVTMAFGPSLVLLFRNRAIKGIYALIRSAAIPLSFAPMAEQFSQEKKAESNSTRAGDLQILFGRAFRIFADLRGRIAITRKKSRKDSNSKPISLNLLRSEGGGLLLPASLALDWRGSRVVAIKDCVAGILTDDELESVLAHELGHIEHRDATTKSIATSFRISFPFNPLGYLVEAAIYREKEISADEFSAQLTRKPASLASALLKIYQQMWSSPSTIAQEALVPVPSELSLLIAAKKANQEDDGGSSKKNNNRRASRRSKLLSKQPTLLERIERLLDLPD